MPYNLLDENETHFVLHDGNESFPVAKFGLDDTTMGRIRSLPQGYADGGMVYDPTGLYGGNAEPYTPEPTLNIANPMQYNPSSYELGGISAEPILTGRDVLKRQNLAADKAISNLGEKAISDFETAAKEREKLIAQFGLTPAETARLTPLEPLAPLPEHPAATSTLTATTGMETGAPGYMAQTQNFLKSQGAQGQGQQFQMPSDYARAFEQMQQGTMAQAEASAEAARQQEQIYAEQIKQMQQAEMARKQQADAAMAEINKIQNDVLTQKIDPTRVWSNMSTGNKVMAGISVFLGGIAGGMQGTENRALNIIQDAVNKDIDAQKAELGKKQNMLSLNMAKYNNINDAAAATKAQLLSVTQAQISQSAAKMGSKQALAAAQIANAQIDMQKAQLINQLSSSQAATQRLSQPQGFTLQDVQTLPKDIRNRVVPLPNGQYTVAINDDDVKPIKEAYQSYMTAKPVINRVKEFMKQGATVPGTQRAAVEESLKSQLMLLTKTTEKLGQITESDMKLIDSLIPQPGSYFQAQNLQKLDQLNVKLDEMLNAAYAGRTGYNKAGMQLKETPVFRGR